MKIFLTGASGYVGSAVLERLKGRDFEIFALARNDESEAKLREKGVEIVRGELADFEVLKNAAKNADAVVHTAFSHNFEDYDDAVRLDREVVKTFAEALAQTNKPLVVTSSSSILGDTRFNEADEDYPFGENSTRKARGEVERDCLQLPQIGIRAVVLRLPLFVYGRAGSSFVPFLINQAKSENSANYIESGEMEVSAVHVDDVADAYFLALDNSTAKGLYNVAAEIVSLKELSEAVGRLLDVKTKSLSKEAAHEKFGKMFDFLSINNKLDASKIKRDLQWKPQDYHSILDDIENGSYRKYLR